MARPPFLQALVAAGIANEKEMDGLQLMFGARHFDTVSHLYNALEAPGLRAHLGQLYATSIGKEAVALDRATVQGEALACMAVDVARRWHCLPLRVAERTLVVAMARPEDASAVAEVTRTVIAARSTRAGSNDQAVDAVQAVFAFAQDIENGIEVHYTRRSGLAALARQISQELGRPSREATASAPAMGPSGQAASAPLSGAGELVRGLLLYSLKHRASDIHIQPMANALALRFPIDR
ncbi:hypothetical protein P3G55_25235, partial [Leptospira sp. 96542]|nr:hypothetical protein [Leptospira sp. 96542]